MLIPEPIAAENGAQAIISPPYENGATPTKRVAPHQIPTKEWYSDTITVDEEPVPEGVMLEPPLGAAWNGFRVTTFAGQYDTHIDSGEDYRTITLASIFESTPQSKPKMAGNAFLASAYCNFDARQHQAQHERGSFVALVADIDKGDLSLDAIRAATRRLAGNAAWLVYSSAHSRYGDRRWRIVLPLDAPVAFGEWYDAQTALFSFLEKAGIPTDRALSRAGQPIYLPNVPHTYKDGTPLRGADGEPIYYQSESSGLDAPGLDITRGIIADGIASIKQRREDDDRVRDQIRRAAADRHANRSRPDDGLSIIETFNASTSVATMLERCGYEQSPRSPDDWRSPLQTGGTYATRIIEGKWVSLSASDVAAGVGREHDAGCYGDAYDLYVHFEHGGDHKSAYRVLGREQRENNGAQGHPDDARQGGAADIVSPADLWARYEAPDLPKGLLPPVIEQFARKQAEVMGTDPAGVAMACLTVCAAAIPDRLRVQVKRHDQGWTQSARIWTALVGNPSAKKTPAINAASEPLKRLDKALFKKYAIEQEDYETMSPAAKKSNTPPQQRRHMVSDATIEAAQEVLKGSPDGILLYRDELAGWFGAMDKYSGGKGAAADRGFWLQAFDGGSYLVNRISRGASLIENLSVSLLGGIQPEPMRKIVADSVDDGLIQRLIPVMLKPAKVGMDVPTGPDNEAYDALVVALTQLNPPDYALRYTEEAQCIRDEAEIKHHGLLLSEAVSGKLASHFGKYDGLFARLSVLWHAIEFAGRPMPDVISAQTTERVRDFLHGFILPSSIAFYTGVLGMSDDHDTIIELAGFILSNKLETVQHRDTQRASRSLKALSADQSRRMFEKLEAFGWVTATASPGNSHTPRWAVNPQVHEVFARRAQAERKRREESRAELAAIFSMAA